MRSLKSEQILTEHRIDRVIKCVADVRIVGYRAHQCHAARGARHSVVCFNFSQNKICCKVRSILAQIAVVVKVTGGFHRCRCRSVMQVIPPSAFDVIFRRGKIPDLIFSLFIRQLLCRDRIFQVNFFSPKLPFQIINVRATFQPFHVRA